MLDTIKLVLDKTMFTIIDKEKFSRGIYNPARGYFTLVLNSQKAEHPQARYYPRLTLTNRFNCSGEHGATLGIEFSAPKLLFGNNFDELTTSDFNQVVTTLSQRLKEMGVLIYTHVLENAPVSAIHYSKNIPLTDGSTPHYIINKIKQANISLSLDVNQTDYRNDGQSYKWHASNYEVAFYDKIKDLENSKVSEKRSIEIDNYTQLNLFESFKARRKFEVLRMELRLNTRQKIKQVLKQQRIEPDLSFKSLFSSQTSQRILIYYLSKLEDKRLKIVDYKYDSNKSLLSELIINNPNLGILKIMQIFGLKLALDNIDPRELRAMFGSYKQRSWYRLLAEAKKVKLPQVKNPLDIMRTHLLTFEPLYLVDFEAQMINNDKND